MRDQCLTITAVLGAAAMTLAACGSPSAAMTVNSARALQFSRCIRSHGVPNFPDPSPGGGIQIAPASGIKPQSPAFQGAQQACKQFAPSFGGPITMAESQRQAALRFARCMRANGQSGFPDPSLTPPPGTTRVLALRGMAFALGPGGIDPKSPAFRRAATSCGVTPP